MASRCYITHNKSFKFLLILLRYLTEREKKLRLRRKHAEEIIAWKKKLDDEEVHVREIEKQGKKTNSIFVMIFYRNV
jgi:hypothetical protein